MSFLLHCHPGHSLSASAGRQIYLCSYSQIHRILDHSSRDTQRSSLILIQNQHRCVTRSDAVRPDVVFQVFDLAFTLT